MLKLIKKIFDLIMPKREGAKMLDNLDYESFLEEAGSRECAWAEVVFDYRDTSVREVIWEAKYHANPKALDFFSRALYERLLEEVSDALIFSSGLEVILAPIPASEKRQRKYGFNAPDLICQRVAKMDESGTLEFGKVLERTREAPRQVDIKNKKDRILNARDVFGVSDTESVRGRTVFVIDDVTTTGATLRDAKRALRESGAREVKLFALAH